jgi:hypothetical protein
VGSAYGISQAGLARSFQPTWPFSPLSQNRGAEAMATDGGAAADSDESEVQDRWERGDVRAEGIRLEESGRMGAHR